MAIAEQILQFFNKDKSVENIKQVEQSKPVEQLQPEQTQPEQVVAETQQTKGKKTVKPKRQNRNAKSGNKNASNGRAKNANGKNTSAQNGKSEKASNAKSQSPKKSQNVDDTQPEKSQQSSKKKRKMLVSVLPGEQVEVVLQSNGRIEEYYVEMLHQNKTRGNIYKGKIHNIDQSLQAAFVNYGAERNGFLQVDEVHPEYYQGEVASKKGERYPPLQKVLRPGQEVLVQVVKEPVGKKGAFLTTYLSLPGRYFVLTPGSEQFGISRKIESEKERQRLKEIVDELNLDDGHGVIVRTVSETLSKVALSRDLQFLKRLWKEVRKKGVEAKCPSLVYEEKDLAFRAARDYLTPDVTEVWIDHEQAAEQMREFISLIFPRRTKMVRFYSEDSPLFARFNLENQLESIFSREVKLSGGGRLVFDQTEALTAVDINSGKTAGEKNFRDLAFRTNIEAAEEIAHQLMLRDIGGQVVIDYIEMKDAKHVREVEKTIRTALKGDKARTDIGKISKYGLQQLVRQRLGISAISSSTESCPHCQGTGSRRNREWCAVRALKDIYRQLRKNSSSPVIYQADRDLALYLLNEKREILTRFEKQSGQSVHIVIAEN